MHRFLLHNDQTLNTADSIVSPGQVGLLNGWGVFSTLRVYDGVLFAWDRHWKRMKHDAQRMRVPFPAEPQWLEDRLLRLVEANDAWNSTLRVVIVRNRGGMWEGPAAAARPFDLIAFTAEVNQWAPAMRLGVVPHARHAASEFSGAKILSWSENLTRYERAHERGFDEVVLLNERGEVAECTSANIFAVQGDRVYTPPLASGCLPGVTRAVLLEEVQVRGLTIQEKVLRPEDLEASDEVFLTSTTREVLPVLSIEGLKIAQGRAVAERLQAAFKENAASYVAHHTRGARVG
jgi:branched-subunit amino acid aminotransferase/4-amino-4-deoxychorismate lyase